MGSVLKGAFTAAEDISSRVPTRAQRRYLRLGLRQAGGKLPLFDVEGQRIPPRTIRACMDAGWAEAWHANPIKPDWVVCKLTEAGRNAVDG